MKKETELKNTFVIVCLIVFILSVGTGVVAPLLGPYALSIGATGFIVGFLFSCFYLIRFMFGTPIGQLADRYGPQRILMFSLFLYPFIALAYYFSSNIVSLTGARLLHGFSSAMLLPMAMTCIGNLSPSGKEGECMGYYNTTLFLANGLGPLLGGYISVSWGIKDAFLTLFYFSIFSYLIGLLFLKGKSDWQIKSLFTKNPSKIINTSPLKIWSNYGILSLANIYMVQAMLVVFMVSFFTLYLRDLGYQEFETGLLLSINTFVIGILQIPLGKLVDYWKKDGVITYSTLLTGLLLLLFPQVESLYMIGVITVLVGISTAFVLSSSSAKATEYGVHGHMGRVMGFLGTSSSLGMMLSPIVCGYISDIFNYSYTFYFIGIAWLLAGSSYVIVVNRRHIISESKGSTYER